ncbi:hypothetical protein UY286_05250 [Paenibacillus polymyxa]|nr:hypothetical protein [Paenibacillus polymyxa]MDY7989798.1 hypothetical protein [Paenibacillus polymyxa]MDY8116843.1 hypothetical protein [Paenibacillus polymyxa]
MKNEFEKLVSSIKELKNEPPEKVREFIKKKLLEILNTQSSS